MHVPQEQLFDELIQQYNEGSATVEDIFNKLINFAKTLEDEEKRYMREGLQNEEELSVFDLLTKPDMKLSRIEEKEVKRIAHELLNNLKKQKFVLDWKKKQQTRAGVKLAISKFLDMLPPVYSKDLYEKKCDEVYKFVYDLELEETKAARAYSYH